MKYINSKTKVEIVCPVHGSFWQNPDNHLSGQGCPGCKFDKQSKNPHHPTKILELFIEDANKIHNNKYDYSKFIYINNKTKGTIICPEHGEFEQDPGNHLKGRGCPECNKNCKISKGEKLVINILDKLNISYTYQYKEFDNIHNRNYIFDFLIILNNNLKYIIEYNGRQHYVPIEYLGGEIRFKELSIRDLNLREFCNIKKYNLLELKYDLKDYEIEHLIKEFLNGSDI